MGYLQDHKTDMEENCAEDSARYLSLIPFIDHIEKGIN